MKKVKGAVVWSLASAVVMCVLAAISGQAGSLLLAKGLVFGALILIGWAVGCVLISCEPRAPEEKILDDWWGDGDR